MPWFGLLAPAKTPMVVVDRLLTDTCATLKSAEMRQALVRQGAEPGGLSSAAFDSYYSSERYCQLVRAGRDCGRGIAIESRLPLKRRGAGTRQTHRSPGMGMKHSSVPAERIDTRIVAIRGVKVMIDADLADLYGVTSYQKILRISNGKGDDNHPMS